MYPVNDYEYEDKEIKSVKPLERGDFTVTFTDGWSLYIENPPIKPKPGMMARLYGPGIGSPVRGVYLEGTEVYYRTEKEEEEHRKIQMYGRDAADWLFRWDDGQSVWSIEMGGIGPSYEQAIQVAAAEILRHLLYRGYDIVRWEDEESRRKDIDEIEAAAFIKNERITRLRLSGAQFGAALNLASILYKRGPVDIFTDPGMKDDRRIQISKNFPG